VKALILAAGEGKRLRPLTLRTPKPLLKIANKPIIIWQIEELRRNGVDDITVHTGYLGWQIQTTLKRSEHHSIIKFISSNKPVGTVYPIREFLEKEKVDEPFFVTNGDNFFKAHIDDLMRFHEMEGTVATMALISKTRNVSNYGVAVCKGNNVTFFLEKPSDPPSGLVNAGIYAFSPSIIDYLPKKKNTMLEHDVFPDLAIAGELSWWMPVDVWFPIDTVDAYYAINESIEAFRAGIFT